MVDGVLEGVLGGETDKEKEVSPSNADPFSAAIAMDEAAKDPGVAVEAGAFLKEQRALTRLQIKHFDTERRLAIHGAKLRRAMDWLKLATQSAIALLVFGLVGGLVGMVWSAAHDHGLVIESFTVPLDMADKLATIDARAKSLGAEDTFQTDWGNDIKIEVPGAGISFSELDRLLRKKLGNQTRVGGTLYYSESALRLSLRTGEGGAVDVAGEAAKIDELCQRAAEAVVGQLQPYKYSKYLEFAGRTDEAMRVVRKSANEGSANERAWAWAQISNLLSATDIPAAYDAGIQAIALDPNIGLGYLNAANAAVLMGHDEILHALGNQAIDLFRHGGGSLSEIGINTGSGNRAVLDAYTEGDYGKQSIS